jgi:hypothetical protein
MARARIASHRFVTHTTSVAARDFVVVVVARAIESPIAPPRAPAKEALARACIGAAIAVVVAQRRVALVDAIDRVVTARVLKFVVAYIAAQASVCVDDASSSSSSINAPR